MFPRSKLVLGCAPLGGLYHLEITQEQARQVIRRAVLTHGIQHLDSAPWYGVGVSEKHIGAILATDPDLQDKQIFVATKVGRVIKKRSQVPNLHNDPRVAAGDNCYKITKENEHLVPVHDYTKSGIEDSLTGSIERLRLANKNHKIDELRLHDCESDLYFEEATKGGGIEELGKLCKSLEDCQPSIGMNEPPAILNILRFGSNASLFKSVLMAGSFNLMQQNGAEVFEFCEEHGIQVLNAGVFGAGLLWGSSNFRYAKASEGILKKRDAWQKICSELGISLPAAAVAFAHLPVSCSKIVFGAKTPQEVDACVAAADKSVLVNLEDLVARGIENQLIDSKAALLCSIWARKREQEKKRNSNNDIKERIHSKL